MGGVGGVGGVVRNLVVVVVKAGRKMSLGAAARGIIWRNIVAECEATFVECVRGAIE